MQLQGLTIDYIENTPARDTKSILVYVGGFLEGTLGSINNYSAKELNEKIQQVVDAIKVKCFEAQNRVHKHSGNPS